MKQITTLLFLLFVAQSGWSQVEMKLKPRPRISLGSNDSIMVQRGGVTVQLIPYYRQGTVTHYSDSSRFSHTVAAGSVFILPQDNMPCLKPDTTLIFNMPVQMAPDDGNMPHLQYRSKDELLQPLRKQ